MKSNIMQGLLHNLILRSPSHQQRINAHEGLVSCTSDRMKARASSLPDRCCCCCCTIPPLQLNRWAQDEAIVRHVCSRVKMCTRAVRNWGSGRHLRSMSGGWTSSRYIFYPVMTRFSNSNSTQFPSTTKLFICLFLVSPPLLVALPPSPFLTSLLFPSFSCVALFRLSRPWRWHQSRAPDHVFLCPYLLLLISHAFFCYNQYNLFIFFRVLTRHSCASCSPHEGFVFVFVSFYLSYVFLLGVWTCERLGLCLIVCGLMSQCIVNVVICSMYTAPKEMLQRVCVV